MLTFRGLALSTVFCIPAVFSTRATAEAIGTLDHNTATRVSPRRDPETQLATSGDAYVRERRTPKGRHWRFGTAKVEKELEFSDGHLTLTRFTDVARRRELVDDPSDVFTFSWNDTTLTGRTITWTLDGVATKRLSQGELLFQINLHTNGVAVSKSYLLYPKENIVQEWMTIRNRTSIPSTLSNPSSLTLRMLQHEVADIDFTYMNGGGCFPQSWTLHSTPMIKDGQVIQGGMAGVASGAFAPIQIYHNRVTDNGIFVGWDYMGAWSSQLGNFGDGPIQVNFTVDKYRRALAPDDSVETPKVFTGVYHGDLDDMSHELYDYQYRYKWDYARAPYMRSVRLSGKWYTGASWDVGLPGSGEMDPVTNFRKMFHIADLLRATDGDMAWRDNGWWDKEGEWNGPNYDETRRYFELGGMHQLIYIPIYDAHPSSSVVQQHPDWITNPQEASGRLDEGNPAVVQWQLGVLNERVKRWGDFEWRKDWDVTSANADSSVLLAQDQGFRRLLQTWLDQNPKSAFHGCNGGGGDVSYEMVRLSTIYQISDGLGCVGADRMTTTAWAATYLFPADKLEMSPDGYWDLGSFDSTKATWRSQLAVTFGIPGETEDPEKIEGLRLVNDIAHYLNAKGVYGRWTPVYHPRIDGDSVGWYIERLSSDSLRGIVTFGHAQKTPITIYPKGLSRKAKYNVSYQESRDTFTRTGAELMAKGISIASTPDAEVLYLNLAGHPGSTVDHVAPTAPKQVTLAWATHMDFQGIDVTWTPGHDDSWVSYYQVYRNDTLVSKVAKGTYYFDHSQGADITATYAIATVDGSGNVSPRAVAHVSSQSSVRPRTIIDDANAAVKYVGSGWTHKTGQWVVTNGTISQTHTVGDSVTLDFTGNEIAWYGRMGLEMGAAAVYLDGQLDQLVDAYDGDAMSNVALYRHAFPSEGQHHLTIVARGKSDHKPSDGWITVDGFSIGHTQRRVVAESPQPGVSYKVTGTGVTLVGQRCAACGMADVYVDGKLVTTIDTYVRTVHADSVQGGDQHNVPLFVQQWPKAGAHTIKLVARSDRNLWSSGNRVMLDALYGMP